MKRLSAWLHSLSAGCGKLPLVAALALVAAARLTPVLVPSRGAAPLPVPSEKEASVQDREILDGVLARRAPELGLTLRHQLAHAIAEEAQAAGYDPLLILAIIDVESDFEEGAVSNRGARGLMQIQPTTLYFLAQKEGLRLTRDEVAQDPALCVRLGVRYLRALQNRFGGDIDFALMAYNAGPTKIRGALRDRETDFFRAYPKRVRRDFRRFREGEGLTGDWALAMRSGPEGE